MTNEGCYLSRKKRKSIILNLDQAESLITNVSFVGTKDFWNQDYPTQEERIKRGLRWIENAKELIRE